MNNQNKQDVGYYSTEARTWVKPSCDLRSETSSCAWTPTEGSDGISHRQLARQARAAPAGDRSQIGSSSSLGGLSPGESLTFGSLTFIVDGAGRVNSNPPAHPNTTTPVNPTVAAITGRQQPSFKEAPRPTDRGGAHGPNVRAIDLRPIWPPNFSTDGPEAR